ncbi:hypothetical protein F4861DRAFT_74396 [Xylaria intraflava]|nr:hypothetical protein F4861DRAFT_74396 [Xylaria intraflava]
MYLITQLSLASTPVSVLLRYVLSSARNCLDTRCTEDPLYRTQPLPLRTQYKVNEQTGLSSIDVQIMSLACEAGQFN